MCEIVKANQLQQVMDLGHCPRVLPQFEGQHDVAQNMTPGKKVGLLKDERQIMLRLPCVQRRHPRKRDLARVALLQSGKDSEQRRFAAT